MLTSQIPFAALNEAAHLRLCIRCFQTTTSLLSASYVAVNMTLLAFAADRRAAVDMDP